MTTNTDLLGYSLRDVHLYPQTRHAQVGRVGINGSPALTTQDLAQVGHQLTGWDSLHHGDKNMI